MSTQKRCTVCGMIFEKPYHLVKHRRSEHPETIRRSPTHHEPPKPESAIDLMIDGQNKIKEAIKLADQELAQLHDRTSQLVEMISKYKKLL